MSSCFDVFFLSQHGYDACCSWYFSSLKSDSHPDIWNVPLYNCFFNKQHSHLTEVLNFSPSLHFLFSIMPLPFTISRVILTILGMNVMLHTPNPNTLLPLAAPSSPCPFRRSSITSSGNWSQSVPPWRIFSETSTTLWRDNSAGSSNNYCVITDWKQEKTDVVMAVVSKTIHPDDGWWLMMSNDASRCKTCIPSSKLFQLYIRIAMKEKSHSKSHGTKEMSIIQHSRT